jgi:hypothetical protein
VLVKQRLEQVALISGMTLGTINLWTGVPLLALWLGSRATGGASISMLAVLVVIVTMAAGSFAVLRALAWLDARQRRLTGRERTVRQHTPWLRSMRGERPHDTATGQSQLAALDYVLVAVVVACVVAFEVWFFFFSPSPLDQRSGRD